MKNSNKTAQDAFERLQQARLGSLVEPTEEYLSELRAGLAAWSYEIDLAAVTLQRVVRDAENAEEEQG
jgi:hypothetical protein